jgi:lipoprotein NlpI
VSLTDLDKAIEFSTLTSKAKPYYSPFIIQTIMPMLSYMMRDKYQSNEIAEDRSDLFVLRGLFKNSMGDAKGSLADLNQAVELNPANNESYLARGLIRSTTGDQKGAMLDCNTAIKLNAAQAEAYYLRGIIRYDGGDEQAGCIDLRRAGELGYMQAYTIIGSKCNHVSIRK